jgi:hypothetical protein
MKHLLSDKCLIQEGKVIIYHIFKRITECLNRNRNYWMLIIVMIKEIHSNKLKIYIKQMRTLISLEVL